MKGDQLYKSADREGVTIDGLGRGEVGVLYGEVIVDYRWPPVG